MPDFHRSMKESLRTPDQGADTVVWLAVSEASITNPSGSFYQGKIQQEISLPVPHQTTHRSQSIISLTFVQTIGFKLVIMK